MAYSLIQSTSVQRSAVTSTTLAFGGNLTSGNLAVAALTRWSSTTTFSSVSWSVGGSASPTEAIGSAVGVNARVAIYYSPNTSSGAHTLSVTLSANGDCSLGLFEYAGLKTSAPLDKVAATEGSGTAVDSGATATLAQTDNLVFAAMCHDFNGTPALTAGSGYTQREEIENNSSGMCLSTEDKRVTSTAGVNGTFTAGVSVPWRAAVAVFQEASGVETPPSVVGAGTAAFTATTAATLAPTLPTGWAAGDIHILIAARGDNTAMTSLSGWTQLSAANNTIAFRTEIWARRAVAGDTTPTITFGSSTVVRGARIIGIRGVDPAVALTSIIFTNRSNAASNVVTFDTLTTTTTNNLLLALYSYEDDPTAASSLGTGWSAFVLSTSTLGNDMSLGYATKAWPTAAATGALTTTVSGGTFANSPNNGIVIALPPIPVSTNPTGTGDVTISKPSFSGSGAYVPPPIDASGGISLRVAALAGAGTLVYPGTGGAVLRVPALSGLGLLSYPGNGGLAVGHPVFAGSGLLAYAGVGGLLLGAPQFAGVGGYVPPPITAVGGMSLGVPAFSGAGLLAYAGSGGLLLGAPSFVGAGLLAYSGSGGLVVSHPSFVGVGLLAYAGAGALAIGHPSFAGAGLLAYVGTGGILVGAPSFGGVGVLSYVGVGGVVLGVGGFAGSGSYVLVGSGGILLSRPDFTGGGVFLPSSGGVGSVSIGVPDFAGAGTLIYGGTGDAFVVGVPSLSGNGFLAYSAEGGITLNHPMFSGEGDYIPLGEGNGGISIDVGSFGGAGYLTYVGGGGVVVPVATFAATGVLSYVASGGIAVRGPMFGGIGQYIDELFGLGGLLLSAPSFGGIGTYGLSGNGAIDIGMPSFVGNGVLGYVGVGGMVVSVPSMVGDGTYRPEDIDGVGSIVLAVGYFSGDGSFISAPISGIGGLTIGVGVLSGVGLVVGLMPSIVGIPFARTVGRGGSRAVAAAGSSRAVFIGRTIDSRVVTEGGSKVEWERQ